MPTRFYFDTREDGELTVDQVGVECHDLHEARNLASVALAELAREVMPDGVRKVLQIDVRKGERIVLTTRMVFESEQA